MANRNSTRSEEHRIWIMVGEAVDTCRAQKIIPLKVEHALRYLETKKETGTGKWEGPDLKPTSSDTIYAVDSCDDWAKIHEALSPALIADPLNPGEFQKLNFFWVKAYETFSHEKEEGLMTAETEKYLIQRYGRLLESRSRPDREGASSVENGRKDRRGAPSNAWENRPPRVAVGSEVSDVIVRLNALEQKLDQILIMLAHERRQQVQRDRPPVVGLFSTPVRQNGV